MTAKHLAGRIFANLYRTDRWEMIDQMVLGAFDPSDWDLDIDKATERELYRLLQWWEEDCYDGVR